MEKKIAKINKTQIEILDRLDLFIAHFMINKKTEPPCIRLSRQDYVLFNGIYDPNRRTSSTNKPDERTLNLCYRFSDYLSCEAWHYDGIPVISHD